MWSLYSITGGFVVVLVVVVVVVVVVVDVVLRVVVQYVVDRCVVDTVSGFCERSVIHIVVTIAITGRRRREGGGS